MVREGDNFMFTFDIKSKFGNGQAILKTTDAEEITSVLMTGDTDFMLWFPDWLNLAKGPFGHYLSTDGARANDLDFALSQDSDISYAVDGKLTEYTSAPKGNQP